MVRIVSVIRVKHGDGDIPHCSASTELLASPKNMPGKLFQDLRKGINLPIDDGFDCNKIQEAGEI